MTPRPIVLILSLLAADPQAPSGRPAPRDEYFLSETRVRTADGKPLGTACGLTRRQYRPSDKVILETGISLDPNPDALPTVLTMEWAVAADGTAKIAERNGRIAGRGTLAGPAWAWTGWTWTGRMRDAPGTLRNTARADRLGVTIRTERLDADGKALEILEQVDTRISRETYEILRSKLMPE